MNQHDSSTQLADGAKCQIREISLHEFTSIPRTERPVLIDVREESEWQAGHAEGALHLSRGTIEQHIREIAPDPATSIVCYCSGGNRSALAAESLQTLGYTHVASLSGGFKAWKEAGEHVTYPEA
ncbi:MAG: sulfurtransferase [Verrucomicrobiaceae bacterium]|nr:MAG: sulfurtransferase [Verrucomicrobiaceae bacterium]